MGQKNSTQIYNNAVYEQILNVVNSTISDTQKKIVSKDTVSQNVTLNMENAQLKHGCHLTNNMKIEISTQLYSISDISTDSKQMNKVMDDIKNAFKNAVDQANKELSITPQNNDALMQNISQTLSEQSFVNKVKTTFAENIQSYNDISQKGVLNFNHGVCDGSKIDFNQLATIDSMTKSITSNIVKSGQISDLVTKLATSADNQSTQKNVGVNFTLIFIVLGILAGLYFLTETGAFNGISGSKTTPRVPSRTQLMEMVSMAFGKKSKRR